MPENDALKLGPYTFTSRLFVGTGKYDTFPLMAQALEASGCQVVTVAVRRVNLGDKSKEGLLDYIDRKRYTILPNTAGCFNAEDALRYARLAREALELDWVKLASGMGIEATRATNIHDFESQFESAIRHVGPRLIEVVL